MDTLPISNLPSPPAATGADCAADGATAADAPPAGAFQSLLGRNLASLAQGQAGTNAAATAVPGDEAETTAEDTAAVVSAEGWLGASESALALLAQLPQQAVHPESPVPGTSGSSGTGAGIDTAIGIGIDDRAGGGSASVSDLRADGTAVPGKGIALKRPVEAGFPGAAELEGPGEAALQSGQSFAEFNSTGPQQSTHAAAPATWSAAAAGTLDSAASAPAAGTPPRIETPLGAPGWSTALADRVVMFVNDKQQIAELHINPPHLGPVDITLTVSDDQTSAVFASPHASVRETLETALPRLREVLAENGINLGEASVTADTPREGSAHAQARSSFLGGGERSASDVAQTVAGAHALTGARRSGLVDLFA